jgi:hypothetical protein
MSARKWLAGSAALAALGLTIGTAPASAAGSTTDTTSITITAGSLDFGSNFTAANFPNTALTGLAQTVTTSVSNWSVNDATGSLLGWNVKIGATRFTDNNGTAGDTSDDKTLPLGSLSLTAPTASAGASQSNLLAPVVQPLTTALDNGTADVPVAVAALTKGQGLWNFTQGNNHLSLVIPATTEAGTYTSTITTTLSSGVL